MSPREWWINPHQLSTGEWCCLDREESGFSVHAIEKSALDSQVNATQSLTKMLDRMAELFDRMQAPPHKGLTPFEKELVAMSADYRSWRGK